MLFQQCVPSFGLRQAIMEIIVFNLIIIYFAGGLFPVLAQAEMPITARSKMSNNWAGTYTFSEALSDQTRDFELSIFKVKEALKARLKIDDSQTCVRAAGSIVVNKNECKVIETQSLNFYLI